MNKFKAFLARKNIAFSAKRYFIDAMGAMAQGLFCTLLVGTILNTLGTQLHIGFLTDRPSVDVGDEVEIFGPDNSVNDMAEQAGTIPYELTCAVSRRVPRVYYKDGREVEKELLLRF